MAANLTGLTQQTISPIALNSLATFATQPLDSQLAASPQFNPSGNQSQFLQQLSQTLAPAQSVVASAVQLAQQYQTRKALGIAAGGAAGALPAGALPTAGLAAPGVGTALSPTTGVAAAGNPAAIIQMIMTALMGLIQSLGAQQQRPVA